MHLKVIRKYQTFLQLIELCIIPLSLYLAGLARFNDNVFADERYLFALIPLLVIFFTVFYIFDLYNFEKAFISFQFLAQLLVAYLVISILVITTLYLLPVIWYGRGVWAFQLLFSFVMVLCLRILFEKLVPSNYKRHKLVIIGRDQSTEMLLENLATNPYYEVVEILDYTEESVESIKVYSKNMRKILKNNNIDCIIISNDIHLDDELKGVIVDAKMKGHVVFDVATFYENVMAKIPVYYISDFWIILRSFAGFSDRLYNTQVKRIADIFLSLFGLIIVSPIMLVTAFLIKLTSKGPVFYRQLRVGYDEEHFEIVKFRSMTVNAEKDGAVWASQNDSRVTIVGRFIRTTRIDELPQLWNILKGEMTLIGPRPERPEFVEHLKRDIPYYSLRHAIKPGLTGWAQVNYRYGASVEDAMEKLQYDLYYIRHLSFFLDLKIILKTVRVVLFGVGAR